LPHGCKFAPRCLARVQHNLEKCTEEEPELKAIGPDRLVRCWLHE
jgi:peptide/nickel transport system ATP-binding protein